MKVTNFLLTSIHLQLHVFLEGRIDFWYQKSVCIMCWVLFSKDNLSICWWCIESKVRYHIWNVSFDNAGENQSSKKLFIQEFRDMTSVDSTRYTTTKLLSQKKVFMHYNKVQVMLICGKFIPFWEVEFRLRQLI